MSEMLQMQKKQDRIFLLVCINFLFFMILFVGFGVVLLKSASLINRLSSDLAKAEETITQLQQKFQAIDTAQLVDQITENATNKLGESIDRSLAGVDLSRPIIQLSDKIVVTQQMLEKSGNTLSEINANVTQLDNDVIARKVAGYVLQGLREDGQLSPVPAVQYNN